MNRVLQSLFYAFLFTLFGGSIYYSLGVFMTLAQGGNVVDFFFETLKACFVLWLFLSFVFYELTGAFERLNQPRDRDERKNDGKPEDDDTPKKS
jgi:hypothetical protein